jgi:signal transduction histidine kinase
MSLHCETFAPSELLEQALDGIQPLLRDSANEIHINGFDALPVLYNDAAKFRQIFTNLLSNANKFTQNGYISINGRELPGKPGWLEFSVHDTGIGMNAEQQSRVFEAFVQAESSTSATYGGTGLGLAICREYSALMGGRINMKSEVGVGSTFTVILPTDPELARAVA